MAPRKNPAPALPRIHGKTVEMVALADLKPYEKNARQHPEDQLAALQAIIADSGFTAPLIIDGKNSIIAGHGRALVAARLKMVEVPCVRVKGLTPQQIKALRLSDNQAALRSTWDPTVLLGELTALQGLGFDLKMTGFSEIDLGAIGVKGFAQTGPSAPDTAGALVERFGIAPFSILNAREGWWQNRKRAWLALGIESEQGRGENLLKMSETMLEPDPAKRATKRANAKPSGGGGAIWQKENARRAIGKAKKALTNA